MSTSDRHVTLHYAPNTRATAVSALLDELSADYMLDVYNLQAGEHLSESYRAINPLAKVPALSCRGEVITEQVAIYIFLADLYPEAGLAPAVSDPLRGPWLRWIAYYGSCFEPAVIDRAMKRDAAPRAMSPYGSFDEMLAVLEGQLAKGEHLLGERFSSADILWGSALAWMVGFGLLSPSPTTSAYIERIAARPSMQAARARDAELVAARAG
jgi:glutathione S-transferase